ncbi:MAG: hypothetical protein IJM15_08300 [Erysipelotrichaceae bacterium]|nr:hypothetical protein [Erysipelotrichaceae bacterium]
MRNEDIIELTEKIFHNCSDNTVHLPEEDCDIPILDEPLIGFASATDPLFDELKSNPQAIGEGYMTPREWMEDSGSVLVFFFPFTEDVRSRLARSKTVITEAWKYGYPAGSALAKAIISELREQLTEKGLKVIEPSSTQRSQVPAITEGEEDVHHIVNWSNRHAGFIAGLGTFGMHRHFISEKGCCGTFAALITDCELVPTERTYTDIYENCLRCGKCAVNCPGKAIAPNGLRNLKKCAEYGAYLREKYGGGGCGRCMVDVPCEFRNPTRK